MPRSSTESAELSLPPLSTAPVLAVLVCHNGAEWLPLVLSALRRSTIRPRHILAVDTGSSDDTAELLAEAADHDEGTGPVILDGVITLEAGTGFADAVAAAVDTARDRWGDPGAWIWLLHDDSAPEPTCLDMLLRAADTASSVAALGPLAVDWTDPRLIVEAGLSTDASGQRRHAVPRRFGDGEQAPEQTTEVLALPSAGALIRRQVWEDLGGFDSELPLLREDIDFGWRANAAGNVVLCVPPARLRHVRAMATGHRKAHALPGSLASTAAADRAYGLRTYLVNCSTVAFVLGLPRLAWLGLLRGAGFAVLGRRERARAEFAAIAFLFGGRANLRAARATRIARGSVRGLFTGRLTRLREAIAALAVRMVRRHVESDAALGRLPQASGEESAWIPPEARYSRERPVGPDALPAGARRSIRSPSTGLRRPAEVVAVSVPQDNAAAEPSATQPSPGPQGGSSGRDLVFVEVDRRRLLAATVFAPPSVLLVALTAIALAVNWQRLGLDLSGGALLPVGALSQVWTTYLESWHAVAGGTASAAPVSLAVLGVLGAPLAPLGGPAAVVAVLLLADAPLAALVAYFSTRRLRVDRWVRAAVAAAYGLLPSATAGVAQGRLDVVVAHILLPAVLAGVAAVLTRSDRRWLSTSVLCAFALAVLGAFSPLALALSLVLALIGFVALPQPTHRPARSMASVAIVVLLPLALLLPWLPTLFTHPALLLHGVGGPALVLPGGTDFAGLDPAGPGALPVGIAVVAAALVAAVVRRPTVRLVPGLVLLVLGAAGVAVVSLLRVVPLGGVTPAPGFTGVPLLFAGAGLLAMVLGAGVADRHAVPRQLTWLVAVACAALVVALGAGGVAAGRQGPLQPDGGGQLAPSLTAELAETGRGVLVLGERVRQVAGRTPRFGDDAIAPVAGVPQRLAGWQRELLAGSPEAVTSAAAAGVLFVVLPPGETGAALRAAAPDLVAGAPPTSDGRAVLRLSPVSGRVTLVSPEQARRAVSGQPPSGELMGGAAVAAVDAWPPEVRVRVSDGPAGRLLVLAAEHEPGWRATVNGEPVPIVPAWGHQVAVSVPPRQSDVAVEYPAVLHNLLLLGQVAALLFTVLTAIPARREPEAGRSQPPSMMSGSTPK
ncbi:GT2 family glycosyltransferase [Saccharomonospora amisosensis]|uniref:GT2 family glycosyltransferase n=1 Tax=Saccharomonospora amisosensis TaxID=1128677 RepID=A0A7X5UMI1_9PSEU|nr:glycosyltransferase family 2 protein [Saccharomonospora amisosensis]NIJ10742.1 GT2 family glycosyltransferase [Saccharomonospora amisosensis]